MKINNIILSVFICASSVFTSCQLERLDYTEISTDNFPKTEQDLELLVNQLYYDFNPSWNGVFAANYGGYQVLSDITTDALWSCWGWEADDLYYQQWYATMGGNLAGYIYSAYERYNYLSRARNVIRRIEAADVREEHKIHYSAEAKALRGWMALYLYDLFGTVPVAPDDVLDNPLTFTYLPRLSEEEYDKMVIDDLSFAIKNLPETVEERGRITKGAAMMMLLKYYMIKGYFIEAEELARELLKMEGKVYSLQQDYAYIFSKEGEGNNEIILQIPCNSTIEWYSNFMTAEVLPIDYPWTEKSEGWGGYVIPWDFYETFDAKDKRAELIVESYTNKNGKLITKDNSSQLKYGPLPLKYGKDDSMLGSQSGIDLVVYRFADVLLSLAECINRNEGYPTDEAVNLVNRVRNRAGLDNLTDDEKVSYMSFNESILRERGHEFYLEGLRRQDLIRFNQYSKYANKRIEKANLEGKTYFKVNESHNKFWIPQTFINESKGQIKQNEGY